MQNLLKHQFPRIEIRNGHPILRMTEETSLLLPPLDSPIALAAYKMRLAADRQRDLEIALFRRIKVPEPSDIAHLLYILEQHPIR